jgi:hypothetical protein
MADAIITNDTATIEIPAWMKPEQTYTVVYESGRWQAVPF